MRVIFDKTELSDAIDRAKGLLMDYYHISEEDAYRRMQQSSMKRGIALADVAQKIVKEIMARKNK